jgi:short-subunit dehydrogenase
MRHIVISGASRGLGAALAQRFAAPGTRLFLTALSAEALAKVAQFCREAGAEVEILACDILTCPPEMFPNFGRVCFSRGRTNETQQIQR